MDTVAAFNVSEALDRADGDRDLLLSLAALFMEESLKDIAAARSALERQEQAALIAAAHKLKGSVLEMCTPRLLASAKRLEELGRQGRLAEASSVCGDVETHLTEVHDALQKLIDEGFPS
jgi:HPt (histidine-containing phosphotransfer) domain-containing protein